MLNKIYKLQRKLYQKLIESSVRLSSNLGASSRNNDLGKRDKFIESIEVDQIQSRHRSRLDLKLKPIAKIVNDKALSVNLT